MPKQLSRLAARSLTRKTIVQAMRAQVEKFPLIADLGVITVPNDYVHETRLSTFRSKYPVPQIANMADKLTDEWFGNPSLRLTPGKKLHVRAFAGFGLDECLPHLRILNGVHVGAQGLTLVWEQKWHLLPDWWAYASFDEKDHLAFDAETAAALKGKEENLAPSVEWYTLKIPYLYHTAGQDGFQFLIGHKDGIGEFRNAFLLFNEVPVLS